MALPRNYLVLEYNQVLSENYDLQLVLRCQFLEKLREPFHRDALECLEPARSKKK